MTFIKMSASSYTECVTYAECRYAECRHAECRYAECRHAECRYAECRYDECRGASGNPYIPISSDQKLTQKLRLSRISS